MPNSNKSISTTETGTALPWKNSLLTKEEPDTLQNPLNYFGKIVQDYDTFSIIYEAILSKREKGEQLQFLDKEDEKVKNLEAFMVIQDGRGCNWICPVFMRADQIDQKVSPLNLTTNDADDAFRENLCFGVLKMSPLDYISACSRGFENASRLFLGDESVNLDPNCRLIAGFYIYPKSP